MKQIAQMLNRRLTSLGVPGIIGLGILIACMAFFDAAIRPMQKQLAQRQQFLNEQRAPSKVAPKVDWRTLRSYLPAQDQADELSAKIYHLAKSAGVDLREAEYKEESLDKSGIAARHLNFVVSGNYFQMRQFLSSALSQMPALALDAVSFQKSRTANGMLDVRIALTLYVMR
jgi:Tfp pilus assembly protein PilO